MLYPMSCQDWWPHCRSLLGPEHLIGSWACFAKVPEQKKDAAVKAAVSQCMQHKACAHALARTNGLVIVYVPENSSGLRVQGL